MKSRFRRSVKIAPGVKVNIGKKSTSVTLGGKHARTTINSSGRVTNSVSTPIKGLSFQETTTMNKKEKKTNSNDFVNEQDIYSSEIKNAKLTEDEKMQKIIDDMKKNNKKIPSIKTYKICSIIIKILSVILILMALGLCTVSLIPGILFAVFGIFLFVTANTYGKLANYIKNNPNKI